MKLYFDEDKFRKRLIKLEKRLVYTMSRGTPTKVKSAIARMAFNECGKADVELHLYKMIRPGVEVPDPVEIFLKLCPITTRYLYESKLK